MSFQPETLEIQLPGWLEDFLLERATCIPQPDDRMSLVVEAARLNVSQGTGGPFAAAVFESGSGKLVSLGVNLVVSGGLSMLHAEMVALALAQMKTGGYDLGRRGLPAHELVASTEPCAMCFGAIPWSGVRRVITGARDSDARSIGFDEGPKMKGWRSELEKRGIATLCDVGREAAAQVLLEYSRQGGKIYNSREP
ncbi:MAG: tRNA-specific adenosine deaminase [Nitrosomonadales bacterium]|nr:MAG: tRNA-specific adenosine deaminase [Nitrosomonadales bacterium]